MSAAALAGRPVSSFLADNFNRGEKVNNKSGRYYWSCKHCPDALRIQGRDNQSISLDEIDAAFALLECEKDVFEREPINGNEVLESQVYDLTQAPHIVRSAQ
jgi:hypothetical protein